MAAFQIEVVTRAIKIRGHQRDRVETVLPSVVLTQLQAGNLGNCIRFVGRLQLTRQ